MRTATLLSAIAILAGCAHTGVATTSFGGENAQVVELPVPPGAGSSREVSRLVDEPTLRLMTIVLREGTLLPVHQSPVAVTIQALSGSGTVSAGEDSFTIDTAHAVVLAPGVPHSVQPLGEEPLVLLVHHAGQNPQSQP